ncbi:hypothetical protein, partial [Nitrospira sp. BLG_2]|uniref:hypothetical protein n=1 Tax=Nitrospira sp. BLG_2 TaxID=3397507 RepID=UPI003B9B80EC
AMPPPAFSHANQSGTFVNPFGIGALLAIDDQLSSIILHALTPKYHRTGVWAVYATAVRNGIALDCTKLSSRCSARKRARLRVKTERVRESK